MVVCELCSREFAHKFTYRAHLRSHFGQGHYPCNMCGKRFFNESNMILHQAIHNQHKCRRCNNGFETQRQLREHENVCLMGSSTNGRYS